MFLWEQPIGLRIFSMSQEQAQISSVLAKNQGLYNGFLTAGLVWGLVNKHFDVLVLFLIFVIVAGIFGALTVGSTVFYVQALPAILALVFLFWNKHLATLPRG
ncbi:UNVERIFIED_CONTAM: hypothetical protein GTU68_059321 [Idotea baltica]|nr:hypothetical protein [Idotea baltica]